MTITGSKFLGIAGTPFDVAVCTVVHVAHVKEVGFALFVPLVLGGKCGMLVTVPRDVACAGFPFLYKVREHGVIVGAILRRAWPGDVVRVRH